MIFVHDVIRFRLFIPDAPKPLTKRRHLSVMDGNAIRPNTEQLHAVSLMPEVIIFDFDAVDVAMKFGNFLPYTINQITSFLQFLLQPVNLIELLVMAGFPIMSRFKLTGGFSLGLFQFPLQASYRRLCCLLFSLGLGHLQSLSCVWWVWRQVRLNGGPVRLQEAPRRGL